MVLRKALEHIGGFIDGVKKVGVEQTPFGAMVTSDYEFGTPAEYRAEEIFISDVRFTSPFTLELSEEERSRTSAIILESNVTRRTQAGGQFFVRLNGDSGNNYDYTLLDFTGTRNNTTGDSEFNFGGVPQRSAYTVRFEIPIIPEETSARYWHVTGWGPNGVMRGRYDAGGNVAIRSIDVGTGEQNGTETVIRAYRVPFR